MAENNDRLNTEWLVISALRENLSLISDGEQLSYNDTIRFAQENFKELFKSNKSFFGKKRTVSNEYEKYEQEALARSRKEKKQITTETLIQQRIDELEDLIKSPANKKEQLNRLKAERRKLRKLLQENEPRITKVTENQALMNDFSVDRPGLEFKDRFAGKYNLYETKTGKQFVLRFLHPGAPEGATGVDLVYEIYDQRARTIRIIAIQYKMWEKGNLYFSQSGNLEDQLSKATKCFCGNGFCEAPKTGGSTYRLPFCSPFLRPTEKIYDTEHLLTSGWHIPLCQIDGRTELSVSDGKILRLENIKEIALNTEEFERLFQQEKIGSRRLTLEEVEKLYRENKVLNSDERIIIHSQKKV